MGQGKLKSGLAVVLCFNEALPGGTCSLVPLK